MLRWSHNLTFILVYEILTMLPSCVNRWMLSLGVV